MLYLDFSKIVKKIKNRIFFYKTKLEKKRIFNNRRRAIKAFLKKYSKVKNNSRLVLIWDFGGFSTILSKNAVFSLALNLRGFRTCFVICDGSSLACVQRGLDKKEKIGDWSKKCKECSRNVVEMARKCNVNYVLGSWFISDKKLNEFKFLSESLEVSKINKFEFLGVAVGKLAWSSTNRYMKGFLIDVDQMNSMEQDIYRKYFYAALVNTYIADQMIHRLRPESLVESHGTYTDYAPPLILAAQKKIPAVSWNSGFEYFRYYFNAFKSVKKQSFFDENYAINSHCSLTQKEDARLNKFLDDRYFKHLASDLSITAFPEEEKNLQLKLKINKHKPIVALFTHINWDYCLDLSDMIFDNANQWVIESVKKMIEIKDVWWILRLHPGEKMDGSLFTTGDLIKKSFTSLPDNIKIIESDANINTYGLFRLIDVGITIFGTVGMELPLFGKPMIVAGEAHFSGKGFSLDAKSREQYFYWLENIRDIQPLCKEQIEIARKYAYFHFIKKHIPFDNIDKVSHNIDLARLEELLPGCNPVLDKICHSIIEGRDVILNEDVLSKIYKNV